MAGKFYSRQVRVLAYRPKQVSVGGYNASHFDYFSNETNAVEITATRVAFKVEKDLEKEPNSCELILDNLNPGARHELTRNPLTVHLSAGWEDDGGVRFLFGGDLRSGSPRHDGPEWTTTLHLADGGRALQHARVNRSYKAGTPAITVVRDAARSMGLLLPKNIESDPALTRSFTTGRQLYGNTAARLTELLQPYGYRWSIQNGRLSALKDDEIEPSRAIVVSQETGLIGSPEFGQPEKNGKPPQLKAAVFLNPEIIPGRLVSIRSISANGVFKVERVTHIGDTHGAEWTTEFEGRAVNVKTANL